jgi:hypothetical protein
MRTGKNACATKADSLRSLRTRILIGCKERAFGCRWSLRMGILVGYPVNHNRVPPPPWCVQLTGNKDVARGVVDVAETKGLEESDERLVASGEWREA